MSEHKVSVYRDDVGEWRWRRVAGNGEVVSDSSEGYMNREHAEKMAATVNPGVEITVNES